MSVERIVTHFRSAGWTIQAPRPEDPLGADLYIERRGKRKAVLVREEPPGPIELAKFGHGCRRRDITGLVVAPDDAVTAQFCEDGDLEFLAAEGILVRERPAVLPPVVVRPPPEFRQPVLIEPVPEPRAVAAASIPRWRWGVVAAIWTAALVLAAYDLVLLFG